MARSPRSPKTRTPRHPSEVRDPDILLRLVLGAIANQEIRDNDPTDTMVETVGLLLELGTAIVRHGMPKRDTLLTACRELVATPPKPSAD